MGRTIRRKFRAGVWVAALCACGSAGAAFAIDPQKTSPETPLPSEPSFLRAIDRELRLGKLTPATEKPKRVLPGSLLAKAEPVEESGELRAPDRKGTSERRSGGSPERGTQLWQILVLVGCLGAAAYVYFRWQVPGKAQPL